MQERVFRAHIVASRETGLPLIIHAREADDEVARILEEERPPPGVMHCFSSGRALADAASRSASTSRFPASSRSVTPMTAGDRARPAARPAAGRDRCPLSRPGTYRGKRNEPAFVAATAAAVAALKGLEPRHLAELRPATSSACSARRARRPMRVTVLGCGPSTGVPVIGGDWGRCDPADRRNRRRRVSVLVEVGAAIILIDTSPDLREQLLDADIKRLDAVVLTYAHADHLHGIDDLRSVNRLMQSAIPLYADRQTLAEIERRFGYVLKPVDEPGRFFTSRLWCRTRLSASSRSKALWSCRLRKVAGYSTT